MSTYNEPYFHKIFCCYILMKTVFFLTHIFIMLLQVGYGWLDFRCFLVLNTTFYYFFFYWLILKHFSKYNTSWSRISYSFTCSWVTGVLRETDQFNIKFVWRCTPPKHGTKVHRASCTYQQTSQITLIKSLFA